MKITLHEAMVEVLRSRGSEWMAREAIGLEIQRRNLYRKRNGTYADGDQSRLRAPEYPHLFECRDPTSPDGLTLTIREILSGSHPSAFANW